MVRNSQLWVSILCPGNTEAFFLDEVLLIECSVFYNGPTRPPYMRQCFAIASCHSAEAAITHRYTSLQRPLDLRFPFLTHLSNLIPSIPSKGSIRRLLSQGYLSPFCHHVSIRVKSCKHIKRLPADLCINTAYISTMSHCCCTYALYCYVSLIMVETLGNLIVF